MLHSNNILYINLLIHYLSQALLLVHYMSQALLLVHYMSQAILLVHHMSQALLLVHHKSQALLLVHYMSQALLLVHHMSQALLLVHLISQALFFFYYCVFNLQALEYCYSCALDLFNGGVNIQTKTCAIYLLYAVYQTQGLFPKAQVSSVHFIFWFISTLDLYSFTCYQMLFHRIKLIGCSAHGSIQMR